MNNVLYTTIGYIMVVSVKYIFIPIIVGVVIRIITRKLFQPQPKRQRKKRSI